MNPINYKTQKGLINALTKKLGEPMSVRSAWWFRQAEYALIEKWGWNENNAAKFVASYKPNRSIYHA